MKRNEEQFVAINYCWPLVPREDGVEIVWAFSSLCKADEKVLTLTIMNLGGKEVEKAVHASLKS